jgi:hypothetical protein
LGFASKSRLYGRMVEMNGSVSPIPQIALANPVVQLLESFLASARAGQITSLAIIAAPPSGGYGMNYAGLQRGDLFIGCHSAAKRLMNDMEAPQKSPIIRATMNG